MSRVLVTGGRNFPHRDFVHETLDALHAEMQIELLIHGACPTGADLFAAQWAFRRQVKPDPHPAAWDDIDAPGAVIRLNRRGRPYNVLAGFQRNEAMLRLSCPTHAVAFRGNNGTADMVQRILRAKRAGAEIDFRDLRAHRFNNIVQEESESGKSGYRPYRR